MSDKTATIDILTTDMGTGVALCSVCDYNLDGGNPLVKLPDSCPNCQSKFVAQSTSNYNWGGSDF